MRFLKRDPYGPIIDVPCFQKTKLSKIIKVCGDFMILNEALAIWKPSNFGK
jgi:hypothetical protein